jgi:hypothetical protein
LFTCQPKPAANIYESISASLRVSQPELYREVNFLNEMLISTPPLRFRTVYKLTIEECLSF